MNASQQHPQLVGAEDCIKIVFPCATSRPSLRSFREWQKRRYFGHVKVGRLTFFDPVEVRLAIEKRFKVNPIDPV